MKKISKITQKVTYLHAAIYAWPRRRPSGRAKGLSLDQGSLAVTLAQTVSNQARASIADIR